MAYSLPSSAIRHNEGMYTPSAFRVAELPRLHALIHDYPFAILVSAGDDGVQTTHLPFTVDPGRGKHGTLLGHVARGNPHWRLFDGKREATAIFTGPHAYVSPSWYADPHTVPTWNYAVVHAHATPRIIGDKARARTVLESLIAEHEAPLAPRWTMDQAEPGIGDLLDHIIVFEMEIVRLEGTFKLSQNRSRADQKGVAQVLASADDPLRRAVAEAMQATLASDKTGT